MKKKLIAVALTAGFTAPAAMADVTLYGFLQGGVESVKATGAAANGGNEYASRTRVSDQNSRLGFKGTEDLGNGTKAIWQIESSLRNFEQGGVNDVNQSATFGTRNTFVGLDNAELGTLRLGQYDSAYKVFTSKAADNLMGDTTADTHGSSSIAGRGEARLKNSVHYTTPNWNGFQAGVSYGVDEDRAADANDASRKTKRDRWSLGAAYTLGTLVIAAGYDRQADSAGYGGSTKTNGKKTAYWQLASSYKFDFGTTIAASYEKGSYGNTAGSDLKQSGYTVAVSQDIGAAVVGLSYNKLGNLSNAANPNDYAAKQWVLGARYNLSKSTSLYGYYTQIKNNAAAKVNFANNPLVVKAAAPNSDGSFNNNLSAGNKLTAIGAGLKIAF